MKIQSLLNFAVTSALIISASASVTMDWVNVGNPCNAADTTGYGQPIRKLADGCSIRIAIHAKTFVF